MHLDPKKMLVSFGCGFFEDDDPLIFMKHLSIPPCPTARRSIQDAPVTAGIMLKNPSRPRGGDNGQSGNQGNGDGDQQPLPNANPPEKKPKVVPLNRKAASKVSSLSSKITDVRCLTTQLENSNLFLDLPIYLFFSIFLAGEMAMDYIIIVLPIFFKSSVQSGPWRCRMPTRRRLNRANLGLKMRSRRLRCGIRSATPKIA